MRSKLRSIAISEMNYLKLKRLGHTGESFNDVITKVLTEIVRMEDKGDLSLE
jgi:predicted CopG family antitoxin